MNYGEVSPERLALAAKAKELRKTHTIRGIAITLGVSRSYASELSPTPTVHVLALARTATGSRARNAASR